MLFTPLKAAQVAAFFAQRQGGRINVLKLVKLIYLADRLSMDRYDTPITYDRLVSMDNGPVPSMTLNHINGFVERDGGTWDRWIRDREDHDVALVSIEFERKDLNQLSDTDLEVLSTVWDSFGEMNQWQLVEFTHQNCPEWTDPKGSSFPIHERDVFLALGRSRAEAIEQAKHLREQRQVDSIFASL